LKQVTIQNILDFKKSKKKFATITAYDFCSAKIVDNAKIPLILVGDSASMVIYGYNTTIPVTMDEMLLVVSAVARGVERGLVVADMPFLSYQTKISDAIKNGGRLIKEGNAGAVKLEGGVLVQKHIKEIVGFGIPVLGHVGLTPQSFHQISGYSIQGKTPKEAQKIIDDAKATEDAGAFGVVLECIPASLAKQITNELSIPTIGIGSGNYCDGQIQVFHDVVGLFEERPPQHAMTQFNGYTEILKAIKQYKAIVEK